MKYFNTSNPPERIRVTEVHLPKDREYIISVPEPQAGLGLFYLELRNFNQYSPEQLKEWKKRFLAEYGDLYLTLQYSTPRKALYVAKYASNLKTAEGQRSDTIARILNDYKS